MIFQPMIVILEDAAPFLELVLRLLFG